MPKHIRNIDEVPDTPISNRRLYGTDAPPLIGAVRQFKYTRCVWPRCKRSHLNTIPLCSDHALDAAYWVKESEEAHERFERQMSARNLAREMKAERKFQREMELRETRGTQPGWIYYLSIDGKVKIGYTSDIVQRMRHYPPGSPLLAVHPGTRQLEKEIHRQFQGSLVQGREWFRPDPDLLEHCKKAVAEFGDPAKYEYRARDPRAAKQAIVPKGYRGYKRTAA